MNDVYFLMTGVSLGALIGAALGLFASFLKLTEKRIKQFLKFSLFFSSISFASIISAAVSHRIAGHGPKSETPMDLSAFAQEHRIVPVLILLSILAMTGAGRVLQTRARQ
jgi:hypothetical protein